MNFYRLSLIVAASVAITACDINEDMRSLSANKAGTDARVIAANNGCMGCHSVSNTVVGPAWKRVAQRYEHIAGAKALLIAKIKSGGKGNWNNETGGEIMPGFEGKMREEQISMIVDYILSLKTTNGATK